MNHTPGKLKVGKISHKKQRVDIDALDGGPDIGNIPWECLFRTYGDEDYPLSGSRVMEANAERMVACWNAFEGIPTEAICCVREGSVAVLGFREDVDAIQKLIAKASK